MKYFGRVIEFMRFDVKVMIYEIRFIPMTNDINFVRSRKVIELFRTANKD